MASRRKNPRPKGPASRRTKSGQIRDFVARSERELSRQFLRSRSSPGLPTMRPHGSILAGRMFNEAVNSSFLPPAVRVSHILRWGYVLGMHRMAAKSEKVARPLFRSERKQVLKEAEELVLDSLQKVGLLTDDVRQQVVDSQVFSEEFLR